MPVIDHSTARIAELGTRCQGRMDHIQDQGGRSRHLPTPPSSGPGAWEAGSSNKLSPGGQVLMVEDGPRPRCGDRWRRAGASRSISCPGLYWRDARSTRRDLRAKIAQAKAHTHQGVMVVHNETSNGATRRIGEVRARWTALAIRACLMVDDISSLGSRRLSPMHRVGGEGRCQRELLAEGLMLSRPGLRFNAISARPAPPPKKPTSCSAPIGDWGSAAGGGGAERAGLIPLYARDHMLYGLREAVQMMTRRRARQRLRPHQGGRRDAHAAVTNWGMEVRARSRRMMTPVTPPRDAAGMTPTSPQDRARPIQTVARARGCKNSRQGVRTASRRNQRN